MIIYLLNACPSDAIWDEILFGIFRDALSDSFNVGYAFAP